MGLGDAALIKDNHVAACGSVGEAIRRAKAFAGHLIKVEVEVVAEMAVYNPFDFFLEPEAEEFPFQYKDDLKQELAPYLAADPLNDELSACLARIDLTERQSVEYWMKKWGVTRDQITAAHRKVGRMTKDIAAELGKKR